MTLPRMPETVKEAMARIEEPMTLPDADTSKWPEYSKPSGETWILELVKTTSGSGQVLRWYREGEESTYNAADWNDPSPWLNPLREIASQRITDVNAINKWMRTTSDVSPYENESPTKNYEITKSLSERQTKSKVSSRTQGRGATILTGGLGSYPTAGTRKQKLGS